MQKLNKNQEGSVFIEALYVIPILFMLFIFIVETGFLIYNWAVINFYNSNAAAVSATQGQFTPEIRAKLAQNISDWTINSQGFTYDILGNGPPALPDGNTVYIYGTDYDAPVQRGSFIMVNIDYPWHFNSFMIASLTRFAISEHNIRLKANASVPSEVFYEGL